MARTEEARWWVTSWCEERKEEEEEEEEEQEEEQEEKQEVATDPAVLAAGDGIHRARQQAWNVFSEIECVLYSVGTERDKRSVVTNDPVAAYGYFVSVSHIFILYLYANIFNDFGTLP